MRILEASGVPFRTGSYEYDESDLSGVTAARHLGVDASQVFKTLVLRGEKRGVIVAVIPVAEEVDLKALAVLAGDKRVEMCPLKELTPLTGYIRGGCSPVGMKKKYPTFIDETAILWDEIYVSAGQRGVQLIVPPEALIEFLGAGTGAITK